MAATLAALTAAVALLADSHVIQLRGEHLATIPPAGRSVVLSFDDGPLANATPDILRVLRQQRVPAVFFLVGAKIERQPQLAREVLRGGHQIGNHSYSHPRMVLEQPQRYADEIDRTDRLIRELGYGGRIDFRPPYGQKLLVLPLLLEQRHKRSVLWSVDSLDWFDHDPESIARRVLGQVQPGSIVLMHDLPQTARALPTIIEELKRRGYRFRTVSPVPTAPGRSQPGSRSAVQAGITPTELSRR